jgi:GMP synthase-like glutamine amidotransferase
MKPIAIFRHISYEGPGYFAEILAVRDIPFQLIAIDEGDVVPTSASNYSGLVFMGGNMSVNDDLPWIPRTLALIRDAVAQDIPLLGHCLGGQLISKALGGRVTTNPTKEIGWGEVRVEESEIARYWFGDVQAFQAFHWHGETFSLPQGAVHLLSSEYCTNQAYVLGKHLGMQCHIEMTLDMVVEWCERGMDEVAANLSSPAVHTTETIKNQATKNILPLNLVASNLYNQWLKGISAE